MSETALSESLINCRRQLKLAKDLASELQTRNTLNQRFLTGVVSDLKKQLDGLDDFVWPLATHPEHNGQALWPTPDIMLAQEGCDLILLRANEIIRQLRTAEHADALTPGEQVAMQNCIGDTLDLTQKNIESLAGLSNLHKTGALRKDIAIFRRRQENLSQYFEKKILTLRPDERRKSFSYETKKFEIQFQTLDWFWEVIPRPRDFPLGISSSDEGDGAIIQPAQVADARSKLSMFVDAWYAVNTKESGFYPTDTDRLNMIRKMPEIATILHCINRHDLFNKFVENEIDDDRMQGGRFGLQELEALGQDASLIRVQYRRLREPEWGQGQHLELEAREPLPLRNVRTHFKKTPGSMVNVCVDAWQPKNKYARKVVWTSKASPGQKAQLDTEIDCLRQLGTQNHGHHFIQFVKTYKRGPDELGMLLQPLADIDLAMFLQTLSAKPEKRTANKASLVRACGCLTYSMCYLHNIAKIRHRDVKPSNVLCIRHHGKPFEFLWADFGLAYDFSHEKLGSGTKHVDFGATEQYEAPEIDRKPGSYHGRSADVFSLGCMFLEIVSVLIMAKDLVSRDPPLHQHFPYKDHIAQLQYWAESKKNRLKNEDKTLFKITELGQSMTKQNPTDRPKIGEVAKELAALRYSFEPLCQSCATKFGKDKSFNPIHPGIFTHTKKDWRHNIIDRLR